MVHKVIQLEPSQRNCPLIMSHVLLSHSPHLSLPPSLPLSLPISLCVSGALLFIYLFYACASFCVALYGIFEKRKTYFNFNRN